MSQEPATGPIPVSPQGPPPPEEAVDQTVRLQAGEPAPPESNKTIIMDSPGSTHPFPQETPPQEGVRSSASTQDLPTLFPDPTKTVTLGSLPDIPVIDRPAEPAPIRPKRSGLLMGILVGAIIVVVIAAVVGVFGYRAGWFGERPAPPSFAGEERPKEEGPKAVITPAIQPYLERAKAGDATAMQMLGYFYYYGMLVPQNREEGLRWYRKAAEAGSVSAQKELANLEGKSGQK